MLFLEIDGIKIIKKRLWTMGNIDLMLGCPFHRCGTDKFRLIVRSKNVGSYRGN